MIKARIPHLLLALLGAGCGAAGGSEASAKRDAGGFASRDAAADLPTSDGRRAEAMPPSVFADAPAYNWDAPGAGVGGSFGGDAGSSGMGGAGGSKGTGGMLGRGGMTSGGDAAMRDAPMGYDAPLPVDGGLALSDATREAAVRTDLPVADTKSDTSSADTSPACVATIVPVVPAAFPSGPYMVASPHVRIVLRAQVLSGTGPGHQGWTWNARWNNTPLRVDETNPQDPAAAAFVIADDGDYSFTASAGNCLATFARSARRAGGCSDCDYGTDLQIVSPPSYGLPTQGVYVNYFQWTPSNGIYLAESHVVRFFTSAGSRLVASYVRINTPDGSLVTDGYVEPSVGFSRPLTVLARNGDLARYQVLVVPLDSPADDVPATAPQLFHDRTASELENNASIKLSGGVRVSGTLLRPDGQPASDARVMLTNQDPAGPATPENLIFSSVGRSSVQGLYALHAQPGRYWATIAPPMDSGLSEALDPSPIVLAADATMGFSWSPPTSAALTLQILAPAGDSPAGNTRVLVSSTQATPVGILTFQGADGTPVVHTANSNVRMEATADENTGLVTFPALPANTTYDVLLVPATLGPAATTQLSLALPAGGASQPVALAREASIVGQLRTGATVSPSVDWSQVQVVAFDKSQLVPEAPRFVWANADGTFNLGVSPGRSYAVVVWPPLDSGLARTFVGPGLLQASAFNVTQQVQATMDWTSSVNVATNGQNLGIVGAALQTTCHPGYWHCIDPSIPLAETTSGDDGTFTLKVPNPGTR